MQGVNTAMPRQIIIFDTTLRDGEQCPGASMNREEKLAMARQLARLKVDVIEAGFPAASPDDFSGVQDIARQVRGPAIAALCRAIPTDIDRAAEAIAPAERGRIHTFIATSPIHMQHKLRMTPEQVLEAAVAAVKQARKYTSDVEFSAEDAVRSDMDFLCRVVEAVIHAGATTVNIPDTVGYAVPEEFGRRIAQLRSRVPNVDRAVISVHCHNDLGLAVANSLAAVAAGAGQVECTVNGIGERAGNASLEEVVMALKTRHDLFDTTTGVDSTEIIRASRLLTSITGMVVQPNKAIVGANAFSHESGIHQDGLLKNKATYEIMTPESVGLTEHTLVLGKHSGRHAFKSKLEELGYALTEEELGRAFLRFKKLADQKKEVFEEDLDAIVADETQRTADTFVLEKMQASSGTDQIPQAQVTLLVRGEKHTGQAEGDGPVDATYRAIAALSGTRSELTAYIVQAISGGTDAQGIVTVKISDNGRTFTGQGADPDIVVASARAYVNALNKADHWQRQRSRMKGP
ncbi:MAG: 2-isopropylmalate synthase [Nitrospirota bacterium]|nr:2-isopropylmalate synthase [Nitrospirota bacterium]